MVKFETWEAFEEAARDLYVANPLKARCTVKHRAADGTVVVTVTDDLMKARYQTSLEKEGIHAQKFACNFAAWSATAPVGLRSKQELAKIDQKLEEELGGPKEQAGGAEESEEGVGSRPGVPKAAGRGGGNKGRGKRRR